LKKEEVRVFRIEEGKTVVSQPDIDPRGLGVEGILTSELFGLPTTLDEITLTRLERRNELLLKQQKSPLTPTEKSELSEIFTELENLGFSNTFRDPLYQKFIIAFRKRYKNVSTQFTKEDLEKQNKLAFEILEEIEKEDQK